jgi:hypothetical protein
MTRALHHAALGIDVLFRLHGDARIEATPSAICCLERWRISAVSIARGK